MIQVSQRQPLSLLYSYFSFGLALMFLGFYFFEEQLGWWQPTSPKLLPIMLSGYMGLAIFNVIVLSRQNRPTTDLYLPSLMAEILLIGFLLLYMAPQQNDLGLIMLITVGLGNLIVTPRFGYLLAAMSTIMILSHSFLYRETYPTESLLSGSVLSTFFFIETFIVQTLKARLLEAQNQAEKSQSQLYSAARLNDLIIERMYTGVCITTNKGRILRINSAGRERLKLDTEQNVLPKKIINRLLFWMEYQLQVDESISLNEEESTTKNSYSDSQIMLSFAAIDEHSSIIFIDDKHSLAKRTSQFKQASLARMAASIAHEIRNPLNAISHASQLLQESPDLNEDDQHLNNIILNHSKRMETIIQTVLQISKRKESEIQWIELKSWLEHFKDEFCKQHPVKIEIMGGSEDILFDPNQLHQVIWNLCSNSIRYGDADEDSPIMINIGKKLQHIELSLEDHGQGIAPDQLTYLFEPFHTTSPQGSGLGLYLVKELCEANHAHIEYAGKPLTGAKFIIRFAAGNETLKQSR